MNPANETRLTELTLLADDMHLRSTGGRPALAGATCRPKISLSAADWGMLKELSSRLCVHGYRVSPGQLAGHLIATCLRDLAPRAEGAGLGQT
jgi:hypothetical protein